MNYENSKIGPTSNKAPFYIHIQEHDVYELC